MGEHEGWAEPARLLPNGLLPNAAPVIQGLDSERWLKAEERTAELIARIQPNKPSEERRNAVADYVQRLITKCFPCQVEVFTFGSVPLKTYLPDGDIDLTAFSDNQSLKDTWAHQVRDMLEKEEKNENAEFRVKEVQYIQAEVKIIKCLVENIVVDISFNQLGGLCTLCFLEEVDHLISQNHLFKRSIILIKAWCYYESRILGAHHGLISTYALETLVLYIFHVFNKSFTGPLEVLYRFLEFFSNFDWDNFCVSLWGPVPIISLPDVNAQPPRKDSGELLLTKRFLDSCSAVYAVLPGIQETPGQPFVSKHFNVIDPLRVNNNLGRSVSKGNFFRIRSAFTFGAKRLERLLDCPKENVIYEVNQFFMNTWERHGSGHRPDAPVADLWHQGLSTKDHLPELENLRFSTNPKRVNENSSDCNAEADGAHSRLVSSQSGNHFSGALPETYENSTLYAQNQRSNKNLITSRVSDHVTRETTSHQDLHTDRSQRSLKSDNLVNEIQGRFVFARTQSSPELTDSYGDMSSQGRRSRLPEGVDMHPTPKKVDNSNRRKNAGSENSTSNSGHSLNDDTSSVRHAPSHQSLDAATNSNSGSNSYHHDSGLDALNEELASTGGTQALHEEEQDAVNMMASTSFHGFNGQVHLPFNLASSHLPFPISPSFLASMGYPQRNMPGLVPTNFPMIDPTFSNVQFPHGLLPPHMTHYFPSLGLSPSSEDPNERNSENFNSTDVSVSDAENDFWPEQDAGSTVGFDRNSGNFEMHQSEEKLHSMPSGQNFVAPSWVSGSVSSLRYQAKHTKEKRGQIREDWRDNFQVQDNGTSDVYAEERMASSRFSSTAHSSPLRSKPSSESSWDGSSAKSSKSARERRGKKTVAAEAATGYGKGKMMSEPVHNQNEDDDQEWNSMPNICTDVVERGQGVQSVSSYSVPMPFVPEYELVQTSGSDSMMPIAPMLIGPGGSQQRVGDNSGVIAFYPTGPPVPFFTMLPFYNIPPKAGTPDASTNHCGGEESIDNSDSGQNFDSSEGLDQSEVLNPSHSFRGAGMDVSSDEHKSDILNSDFASHWQNLQYGRSCQSPRYPGPLVYPSPVMVPPMYLQGRFSWDGPGRPVSTNANVFTEFMSYGHHVPIAPIQSVSDRPANMFQHDMPRYRSGTGTYLPNHPKVSARDRNSSGTRRGNYNNERSDNGDREGNWNANSKPRGAGRGHNRNPNEKSNSRTDRFSSSENRADRPWNSYRNGSFNSYPSQNGPMHANSNQISGPNVTYGMYPLTSMNPMGASSNGPPVVMIYPFDHNAGYGSHGEQLEFGSLGPVGISGTNEQALLSEGGRPRGGFEQRRFHGQRSSPDQPSSPRHPR
ncbi:uncharacterized protein LOC116016477 isoform X2 [Ipomoea triloba]|nr:uncharacterized protein LOC116016477 isoform X2 [Ipomoea triloba]XP_031112615.1 uncharacterized protein LOC116016477 isoform X2 [Ipomoea triloba]